MNGPARAVLRRAFIDANLMRNPFGEPDDADRGSLAVARVPVPLPGSKTQVLGDAGAGKSSTLRALQRELQGARYLWTAEDGRLTDEIPPDPHPVLLDEAQRWRDRGALRALLHSGRTVVIASHVDLSTLSRQPMTTVTLSRIPAPLLDAIIDARLQWARRGPGPVAAPPPHVVAELLQRHPADLRAIEHALYFWYQQHWG